MGQTAFTKKYHSFQGTTLPYFTSLPAGYDTTKSYPVVVCLHGSGERGNDSTVYAMTYLTNVWTASASQATWPCFVVVPQCPALDWWTNPAILATIVNLLDSLASHFPIDTNRLYVTGYSMGGSGTWDLAIRYPEKFAAIVPISGTGDPTKASTLRRLPIWAFHGEYDSAVPVTGSRYMVAAIEKTGISLLRTVGLTDSAVSREVQTGIALLYTEFPDEDHLIWYQSYHYPNLLPWVFSKSRLTTRASIYTRNVHVEPTTPRLGKDTVAIRALVDDPQSHAIIVTALLVDAASAQTLDSMELFDDGMHRDGQPGDGLWGRSFVPATEGVYGVNVRAHDPTAPRPSTLANTAHFATAGPITVDRAEVSTTDTTANPGDALRYRVYLRNRGLQYVIKDVTAVVKCLDTTVTLVSNAITYGEIAPGQSSSGAGLQTVRFSPTRAGGYSVNFIVEISSGGVLFWTDTFQEEVTGVQQDDLPVPATILLLQNYPNPINPTTKIGYRIAEFGLVKLAVYNLLGQEVAVLVNERKSPGTFEVKLDATGLPSGVYLYRMTAGSFVQTRKMIVVK